MITFKEYLQEAKKEVSIEDIANEVLSSFKAASPRSTVQRAEVDGKWANASIRDFGVWRIPDGEDDGDGDYDWEELVPEWHKKAAAIVDAAKKKHAGFTIQYSTEEKNWISIQVKKN